MKRVKMSGEVTKHSDEESQRKDIRNKDTEMEADDQGEYKVITLNATKNVNKEWSDTKSMYKTLKVGKKIFEEWMKEDEALDIVYRYNQRWEQRKIRHMG